MPKLRYFLSTVQQRVVDHRGLLIDLILLWLACSTTEKFLLDQQLPWMAQLTAVVVALFFLPGSTVKKSGAVASSFVLRRLLAQLGTGLVTGLIWSLFFNLPLKSLCFVLLWLPAAWALPSLSIRRIWKWVVSLAPAIVEHRLDVITGEGLLIGLILGMGQKLDPGLWPWILIGLGPIFWILASKLAQSTTPKLGFMFFGMLGCLVVILLTGARWLGASWRMGQIVSLAWVAISLIIYRWRLKVSALENSQKSAAAGENLRWITLATAGVLLLHPFLIPSMHGTGDALWYGTMLADMMAQIHAGVFPVFSGQSIYQFNGSIYPLRVAPAFHHAGALIDVLTGFTLGPVAVLNALLFCTGMLALAFTYLCLRALLPTARWIACGLAILYLSCPGTLGLAFNTDLFMSWMTVPWLPVALFGSLVSFQSAGYRPLLALAGGLGMLWWGHTPIALWTTILAAAVQLARIWRDRKQGRLEIKPLLAAAGLFAALVAYPVGSVLLYPPESGVNAAGFQAAYASTIAHFLAEVRPLVFLPLSENGRALGDFQLGYTLWLGLAIGLVFTWRRRAMDTMAMWLSAALLAVLLNTPAALSTLLWSGVPAFVRNTTGNWVMNRLYLIQSGFIIFGLAAVFKIWSETQPHPQSRRSSRLISILFIGGILWSMLEATKFAEGSHRSLRPPESGMEAMLPENVQITRFAYLVFPRLPAYFTHGVTEPALEQRLFRASDGTPLADNFSAAARGKVLGTFSFAPEPGTANAVLLLSSPLRLLPGHHYLLAVDFREAPHGLLQIKSPTSLSQYALPEYGETASFGYGGQHSRLLAVSNHTSSPQNVELRYFFDQNPSLTSATASPFEAVHWIEYDPAMLPARVENWIPYQARVQASEPAWLETPRMYQTGYVAQVDGQNVAIKKSSEGLISIAVPAGSSRVELRYQPPVGLKVLYWLSLGSLIGMVAATSSGRFWPKCL
ncbi:MAG: YfhO family protein [Opitutaceae bacterium]